MFQTSIAKDIARKNFLNYVASFASAAKLLRSHILTLILPGPEGIEIPHYLKFGIHRGSILGVERNKEVFKEIQERNWGINLYQGTFDGLYRDLFRYVGTGEKPENLFLVPGFLKEIIEEGTVPRFLLANIDLCSDAGNLALSAESNVFQLIENASLLTVTTQAKRDPLSAEWPLPFLRLLLDSSSECKDLLQGILNEYLVYTENRIDQANRLLLRDLTVVLSFLFKKSFPEECYCDSLDKQFQNPSLYFNVEMGVDTDLFNRLELMMQYVPIVEEEWFLKEFDPFMRKLRNGYTRGEFGEQLVKLFDNESILDIVELVEPITKTDAMGPSIMDFSCSSRINALEKIVYHNNSGTPMLMMMFGVVNLKDKMSVLDSAIASIMSLKNCGLFHIDKNGSPRIFHNGTTHTLNNKLLEKWRKTIRPKLTASPQKGEKNLREKQQKKRKLRKDAQKQRKKNRKR